MLHVPPISSLYRFYHVKPTFNLLIYDLFSDVVSYSDPMSSGKIVRNSLTGLCSGTVVPNLRYYTYVCLEAVMKTTRNFSHVIVCPG